MRVRDKRENGGAGEGMIDRSVLWVLVTYNTCVLMYNSDGSSATTAFEYIAAVWHKTILPYVCRYI